MEQNFESKINKARLKLLSMMILALCKIKTLNYQALANVFESSASSESSIPRIQRFMADFDLPVKLISLFIFGLLPQKKGFGFDDGQNQWEVGKFQHQYSDTGDLL